MEYPLSVKVVGRLTIDCEDSDDEGISEGPDALQSPQSNGYTHPTLPCLISPMNSHFSYSNRTFKCSTREMFNNGVAAQYKKF